MQLKYKKRSSAVSESQQIPEASLLITELLHAINQNGFLMEHLRVSWTMWLSKRTDSNPILMSILKVIETTVTSPSIFGDLMEAALEAYFKFNGIYIILLSKYIIKIKYYYIIKYYIYIFCLLHYFYFYCIILKT